MEVFVNSKPQFVLNKATDENLKYFIEKELRLKPGEYYLVARGKRVNDCTNNECNKIHVIPRVLGGKGGFGSMLRAIGAQIEKTTNREACRDLSGRRLRDINEEQRLKNWISQQAEREKEAKERKQKKLERLCEKPKHEFKDDQYDKERSELPEIVEDAVIRGLQASCSTKRKATVEKVVKTKKAKLWVDDELDDDLSSSGDEDSGSNKNSSEPSGNSSSLECTNEIKETTECSVETETDTTDQSNNGKAIDDLKSDSNLKNDEHESLENDSSEINRAKEGIEKDKDMSKKPQSIA